MRYVSASEVASFVFCPRSWYLNLKGFFPSKSAMKRMNAGAKLHKKLKIENARYVEKFLISRKYMLVGRPDFIIEEENILYPLEFKATKAPPYPYASNIAQLLSYCILVEENFSRPRYGIIKYLNNEFKIPYDEKEKKFIEHVIFTIHTYSALNLKPKAEMNEKCKACGYANTCLRI
ncbi:MAG: CRISPR-associated protein Cas4 [Candidatus Hydrothermarchaeota archaeon]|nr:MAG: CRISPR-associated protein Cas4 [Candidatus Hydrothermarchaeota archaeon]